MNDNKPIDEGLVLGIDLGVGSCGTALACPDSKEPIVYLGSRCFDLPEQPKTRETKNKQRRDARLMRRNVRRRKARMAEIRALLVDHAILPSTDPADLHQRKTNIDGQGNGVPCPWESRAAGLKRELTAEELAIVLIHIAKHRGFKSNSKRDFAKNAPAEDKKLLGGIAAVQEKSARYETVGQMFAEDKEFAAKKRNSDGDYSHSMSRDLQADEVKTLFERQRKLGNGAASPELEKAFCDIAFFQRPLADSEDMVGYCPFEAEEKRAAKHSHGFELFRVLCRLAAMEIKSRDGSTRRLSREQIGDAVKDFGKQKTITYKTLRKNLHLRHGDTFDGLNYGRAKATGKDPETRDIAATAGAAAGTYALCKAMSGAAWQSLIKTPEILDDIAFVLSFREDIESIRTGLAGLGLEPLVLDALMGGVRNGDFANFSGAGHISAKAARAIIPHLLDRNVYSEACELAGYDHAKGADVRLEDIRNPVAARAIREAVAQVRTLIMEFGVRPGRIHVELAREIGKSGVERGKIKDGLDKRESEKERNRAECMEKTGIVNPSAEDLLRFELWKEQRSRCIYTDAYISPPDIASERNSVQIDHILPRSRSQDNSYLNKVLCTVKANQEKKNRTPWEWKGEIDAEWWADFNARVDALDIKGFKKRNLLMKNFDKHMEGRFVARNLHDTRYAARVLMAELQKLYPEGAGKTGGKTPRRIFARPGPLTAMVRKSWGFKKDRSNDRHHALDALVVAFVDDEGMLHRLTRLYQKMEAEGRSRATPNIDPPWPEFRKHVEAALRKVRVSRSERRRGRGKAHDATIRQVREENGKRIVYERKAVEKLTSKDLERVKDPDRNKAIVESVSKWIARGKPKEALPRSPKGDVIRKLRLQMGEKAGVTVRGGHADNADMVRTDVFRKDGKYYLVPIYTHQVADRKRYPVPPDKAIAAHKSEEKWARIDATFEFRFSLYPNSYVEVVKGDGEVIEGYFRSTHRGTGKIVISPHNRRKEEKGAGARTLLEFRKFNIDRLGRMHEVRREKRTWHGAVCT